MPGSVVDRAVDRYHERQPRRRAGAVTRAVYKHMAKRGGGAIVNQSSTAAWLYSNFYGLRRCAEWLTQQLARELGGMEDMTSADRNSDRSTPKLPAPLTLQSWSRTWCRPSCCRGWVHRDLVGMCLFLPDGIVDHRADLSMSMADRSSCRPSAPMQYDEARPHKWEVPHPLAGESGVPDRSPGDTTPGIYRLG